MRLRAWQKQLLEDFRKLSDGEQQEVLDELLSLIAIMLEDHFSPLERHASAKPAPSADEGFLGTSLGGREFGE